MKIADKPVEHAQNCGTVSGSLNITDDKLFCIPCNYTAFRNNAKHFVTLCIQHFHSDLHKEKCCWTINKDKNIFTTVELQSSVSQTLDQFIVPEFRSDPDSITVLAPAIDVNRVIDPLPSKSNSPFILTDNPLTSIDSALNSHANASTQFSPHMADFGVQKDIQNSEVSTQYGSSFEDGMKDFLQSECKMKLRKDFSLSHMIEAFSTYPLIKDVVENSMMRIIPKAKHNIGVKTHVIKSALMHSQKSALDWSVALGGPRHTTIKIGCQSDTKILPYLNIENMERHLNNFLSMLKTMTKLKLEEIPVIAALDATAVTGRLFSRSCVDKSEQLRHLYGLDQPGGGHTKKHGSDLSIWKIEKK